MKRLILTLVATLAALIVVGVLLLTPRVSSQAVQRPPQSRLGIIGVMGFVLLKVDPGSSAEQAGLKPGDIITVLNDQITSIQDFQSAIGSSTPGTTFDIEYLRFNPATGTAEKHETVVKAMPFTSGAKSGPRNLRVSATTPAPGGLAPQCSWCCDRCLGFSPDKYCARLNGYTGYVCYSSSGFRCSGAYCA